MFKLFNGDCLEAMQELGDESVDSIITDPPYGLGKVKNLPGLLKAWIDGDDATDYVGSSGFMGQEWDKTVPSPDVWRECLRVLKPGGKYFLIEPPHHVGKAAMEEYIGMATSAGLDLIGNPKISFSMTALFGKLES